MTTVYTLVIPNTARTQVLLVGHPPHGRLPEVVFAHPPYWQVVGPINAAVREQLGLVVTTLRCRAILDAVAGAPTRRVYELELHAPPEHGAAARTWRGRDALDDLPPEQRAILEAWFDDAGQAVVPARRVPWYRAGWRDPMLAWLKWSLHQAGRNLTGTVEQVRSWERASLWRAPTTGGGVYVKASPPMFAAEPALTTLLAERLPTYVPRVLTHDAERRWLVLADAGGQPLVEVNAIARWEAALRAYARMQLAFVDQIDALHARGVPHRGLAWLRAGLERLLADSGTLMAGPSGLSVQEVAALQRVGPELRAAIATLEQSGLPLSLEHGDFSAWQVQVEGDALQFLDWSDSSVAPPFFSLLGVLGDSTMGLPGVPDAAARLRDAYLSQWTALAGLEELRQLYAVAHRLAPLHHALIYYRDILPAMEQRWEMEQMLPYYLRLLL